MLSHPSVLIHVLFGCLHFRFAGGVSREEVMSSFVLCTADGALGAKDGVYGNPNYSAALKEDRVVPWVSDGLGLN